MRSFAVATLLIHFVLGHCVFCMQHGFELLGYDFMVDSDLKVRGCCFGEDGCWPTSEADLRWHRYGSWRPTPTQQSCTRMSGTNGLWIPWFVGAWPQTNQPADMSSWPIGRLTASSKLQLTPCSL